MWVHHEVLKRRRKRTLSTRKDHSQKKLGVQARVVPSAVVQGSGEPYTVELLERSGRVEDRAEK